MPWSATQVLEGVSEDAQPLPRVEVKRQEGKTHRQVDTPEQFMEDKPWKNESLRGQEEALPTMEAQELKIVASSHKTSAGVGADGFHPTYHRI